MGDQPITAVPLLALREVRAENFKRLVAVSLSIGPGQTIVEITGKNGQGKTSLLDAIACALAGGKAMPSKPIREGQEKAEVFVDIGQYRITRTWTEKGAYLKVENVEGARFPSPQALLDKLYGDLTFDPLDFMRKSPAQQREIGLRLAGLTETVDVLDAQRKTAYAERTETNRAAEEAKGALAQYGDLPEERPAVPDVSELLEERRRREEAREAHAETRRELEGKQAAAQLAERSVAEAEEALRKAKAALKSAQDGRTQAKDELAAAEAGLESSACPDLSEIDQQIASAGEVRDLAQRFDSKGRLQQKLVALTEGSAALSSSIAEIDRQKREAVKSANLPIEGLGFDDDGVTLNGIPLGDCSQSEQLRVGVAIAMALNPKLRMLRITDGSLLDSESFQAIAEMAGNRGYVVLLERVDEPEVDADGEMVYPVGVYIEAGEIAAVNGTPIPKALPKTEEAEGHE